MKIVRVIARLNVGGPAKHVSWLTAGLQDREWNSILVAGSVPPGEDDMSYFATQLGVQPIVLREVSREISPKDVVTIWKLFRLLLRERPDVVHTHTAKAGTVGRIAGLMYRWLTPATLVGRPRQCYFVHTYHGHIFHGYYGRLKTRLFLEVEKWLARLATNRIVVISEQQRREINETFKVGKPAQFTVIPLGLDLDSFSEREKRRAVFRNELNLQTEEVAIGIVGRLTEIKNHDLFLKAVALFKENNPQRRVKFIVIGDGHLREALEAKAKALDIKDSLTFAGGREDPENFYAGLDIVALTSNNEGTPLTLIEAMANGIPVVSTAVGGVVDLLGEPEHNTDSNYKICRRGISVRPKDAEGFAAALARLVGDRQLRSDLGARGLEFVRRNYSKDRLLDDIRALYRALPQRVTTRATPSAEHIESRVS